MDENHQKEIRKAISARDVQRLKELMSGNHYEEDFLRRPFLTACANGDKEVIKYLMTSKDFEPNPRHARGVESIFAYKHEQAIQWLIFEFNMHKSGAIEEILIEMSDREYAKYIEGLFERRALNKELEKSLATQPTKLKSKV